MISLLSSKETKRKINQRNKGKAREMRREEREKGVKETEKKGEEREWKEERK